MVIPTVSCRSGVMLSDTGMRAYVSRGLGRAAVPAVSAADLARAVPLCTCPVRDDGWDLRNDASREPDRGRANQVVLLLRRPLDKPCFASLRRSTTNRAHQCAQRTLGSTLNSAVTERSAQRQLKRSQAVC